MSKIKYISPETADEIKKSADLYKTIDGIVSLKKSGADYVGECPMCHGKGKLKYSKKKSLYKCFSCDFGGNNSVQFVMSATGKNYNETLEYLADQFNVVIPEHPHPDKVKTVAKSNTFKNRQLHESGLDIKDVRAMELTDDGIKSMDVFESATLNEINAIVDGDDMIIHYLDLDGRRVQYKIKDDDKKLRDFYRVRWQFPESHPLKGGDICKYKTPYGASVQLYIPETLRSMYKSAGRTKRLFFTEGEKKAEKMCKHGMPAFGMPGINSLVGKNKQFPDNVLKVIERCDVKEVFLVLDSDFRDLPNTLPEDKDIAQRSKNFYYAAKNFRDWFQTLANRNIYLEVYLICGNTPEEKGIDDLLAGSLAGKERDFISELEQQINDIAKKGNSAFANFELYKISTIPDLKLLEIWNLNDRKKFCDYHAERLKKLPAFKYGNNKWRYNEDGEIELAQPLYDDEKFWMIQKKTDRGGNEYEQYSFDYVNMLKFFRNRGFYRIHTHNNNFDFIRVEGNILRIISHYEARDFAMDLAKEVCEKPVVNMLLKGGKMYFGPESISNIDYYYPQLLQPQRDSEKIFFKTKFWEISSSGIEEKEIKSIEENIWNERMKDFDATRTERLIQINRITEEYQRENKLPSSILGKFDIKFSESGEKCDYAKFLYLASNFYWEKFYNEYRAQTTALDIQQYPEEIAETNLHFMSKMCSIGYLLHQYRDKSCEKAIIGMDGKLAEVGESNGRSGKSLVGFALEHMLIQAYVNGKSDLEKEKYIWQEVTEKTENIFIDDVRVNFDFEMLFTIITGKMNVEPKGAPRFTLSGDDVPKIYLTTNHSINGDSGSMRDRQFRIAFCDFFDDDFKPRELFGKNFFDEWDANEWNLFYNFMGECLELYFVAKQNGWGINGSGLIKAPTERLERRQLRQEMSETFFCWFNDYLNIDENNVESKTGTRLNTPMERKILFDDFMEKCPSQKKFCTPQLFWKRMMKFCRYWGLRLNPVQTIDPEKPGKDKRSSVEYITIANKWFDLGD